MHILIIPSEEFIPEHAKLSGIFQYDQAIALRKNGCTAGVVSITAPVAIKTTLISLFRKCTGRKTYYKVLEGESLFSIFGMLLKQLLFAKTVRKYAFPGLNIIRIQKRCWSDLTYEKQLGYFRSCLQTGVQVYEQRFGKPSLIHAHNAWFAGIAAMAVSERVNIPYCITEHSTFYARKLIPQSFYPTIAQAFKKSKKNIVVSPALGQALEKEGLLSNNYCYLPNILDPTFQQPLPDSNLQERKEYIFLNIAELTHKKGQAILLKAYAGIFRDMKDVRLVIAGDGETRADLKKLAEELGITEKIDFAGPLSREEVVAYMNNCDVFVLPSLFETFGVVLIEAMAFGKPVIATKCGGPEVIVNDSNGILIEPGNEEHLSKAMYDFYTKKFQFDPIVIRKYALDNFNADKIANDLINIYKEIIGEQK